MKSTTKNFLENRLDRWYAPFDADYDVIPICFLAFVLMIIWRTVYVKIIIQIHVKTKIHV